MLLSKFVDFRLHDAVDIQECICEVSAFKMALIRFRSASTAMLALNVRGQHGTPKWRRGGALCLDMGLLLQLPLYETHLEGVAERTTN